MSVRQPEVRLRPARSDDEAFLRRVFASTRSEFAEFGLAPEAVASLLAMQYEAQTRGHREQYPSTTTQVIEIAGQAAGRLCLDRGASVIRVVDIALLAEHRDHGIGTLLLSELITDARSTGRMVRLSAVRTNPALRLYERLGFRATGGDEVYLELEYATQAQAKTA